MDFFTITIIVVVAYWLGWQGREEAAKRKVDKMFKEIDEQNSQSDVAENTIVVRVEKHGDDFYLFDETTDEFVAQGKNIEEIREVVYAKYRGKKNIAVRKDSAEGVGLL
jgi:membrane-anchored protein YejM (alkaline phosphatase superfamily)